MAFRIPTHVTIAPGCVQALPRQIAGMECQRVLVVIDRAVESTPWAGPLLQGLMASIPEVIVSNTVEPNPKSSTVNALGTIARNKRIDAVVGIGGGSVLDAAKAAAMLAKNEGDCEDYEGRNQFPNAPVPFVAVPTTCGTGSEVTWVSVISVSATQRKISIKGESMFPSVALVDADLLSTLPRQLVAWTGMDALTHAVEAYIGKASNLVSDALAEKAIRLIFQYLRRAVDDVAHDHEAREAMARASTLAGLAFGNADVGGVHCLSETIGGMFDTPHGLANAILLPPVLQSHLEAARPRFDVLGQIVSDVASGGGYRFVEDVRSLAADVGVPSFSSLGIASHDHQRIAEGAVRNNSNDSNPRTMTASDYLEILERAS